MKGMTGSCGFIISAFALLRALICPSHAANSSIDTEDSEQIPIFLRNDTFSVSFYKKISFR